MSVKIKEILEALLDFFFPSHCMSCCRAVKGGALICSECNKNIEKISVKTCIKCGMPLKKCECYKYVYHFLGIIAPFFNKGIAQRGLYRLKFTGAKPIVSYYGDAMCECYRKKYSDVKFDAITFVPMNLIKGLKRGYNQAEWLAEYVAEKLEIPLYKNLLKRKPLSKVQHKRKGISNRFLNAYKSYERTGSINGGTILLIDDIKTTGASLDACAKELLYAGANEVYCLTALLSDKNS